MSGSRRQRRSQELARRWRHRAGRTALGTIIAAATLTGLSASSQERRPTMRPALRPAAPTAGAVGPGGYISEPSASLFRRGAAGSPGAGVSLEQASYTYIPTPPPREIRKHDIVTIRVDHLSRMLSDGESQRRKTGQYNAILQEMVLFATGQGGGEQEEDPEVATQLAHNERSQIDLETQELMQFNIAATVADIYPNGNVVLEAHRTIKNNEETWDYSLTGICRHEDINPNTNTVLSRDIADLSIHKRERGQVRDGYRRGWLTRLFDVVNPF